MLVIPAIDLRGGKCVRLRQGDYQQETVFHDDPVVVALQFVAAGAQRLHLVDLDGAKAGEPVNTDVIAKVVQQSGVPCQLGGGLRDESAIRTAFALGIQFAILGTRAIREPDWLATMTHQFPQRIIFGVDAKYGVVAVAGWQEMGTQTVQAVVAAAQALPLAGIVYTDISKDGMMAGPNVLATQVLTQQTPHLVIASGGVSRSADVLALRDAGVRACIIGRALYEGTIQLPTLFAELKQIKDEF